MRPHDKIWMAGMVDGEGSISILRIRKSNKKYLAYVLRVQVANTELELVEPFLDFGGYVHTDTYDRWKPCFKWNISARKAATFLKFVQPYIRSLRKRELIEIALKFQAHQKPGGDGKRTNRGPQRSSEAYRAYQEEAWNQMRELNRRGKEVDISIETQNLDRKA